MGFGLDFMILRVFIIRDNFPGKYKEGNFTWDYSMEPVVYSNWAPGEPNEGGWSGSSEDCAVMGTNKMWNDVPCRYARAYAICESLLKPTTNLYTYAGIGVGVFVLLLRGPPAPTEVRCVESSLAMHGLHYTPLSNDRFQSLGIDHNLPC